MEFAFSDKAQRLQARLLAFMEQHVHPNEPAYDAAPAWPAGTGKVQARASEQPGRQVGVAGLITLGKITKAWH